MLSRFDTFGMAALEAMAASLPVIVSDNVGAKDIVKHGINGFVVEERTDIDATSEKIGLLLNREVRIRMGEAAYETAMNNSWEAVARKYKSIYDEIIVNA
jgi:glycosyltransferase involved in cell wall biosynthesis